RCWYGSGGFGHWFHRFKSLKAPGLSFCLSFWYKDSGFIFFGKHRGGKSLFVLKEGKEARLMVDEEDLNGS
ncbi:MAG: hypothetical protein ABH969_04235, partial [Pseudomonadota bacterium]